MASRAAPRFYWNERTSARPKEVKRSIGFRDCDPTRRKWQVRPHKTVNSKFEKSALYDGVRSSVVSGAHARPGLVLGIHTRAHIVCVCDPKVAPGDGKAVPED